MSLQRTPELPLVSVLTPSFNQRAWLGSNLESVLSQRYPRIEHVVVDGGSTDSSVDLLRAAGGAVSWISEPDRGQSDAINKALRMSHGDILGWLNSDDAYFSRDAVAAAVAAFQRWPDADVVYGHAASISGRGRLLFVSWVPPFSRRLLPYANYIRQPSVFIRRSCVGDDLVDPRFHYAMDKELWLRLSRRVKFRRVARILAVDREHTGRKGYARLDLAASDAARLRDEYRLPVGWPAALVQRVAAVILRLGGVLSVAEACHAEAAFRDLSREGLVAVFGRQVGRRRCDMRIDE